MVIPRLGSCQVNSWTDNLYLGQNESGIALAEEYCGPTATSDASCDLRTAFLYASSLIGGDVEILVNMQQEDLLVEQSTPIQVSGYVNSIKHLYLNPLAIPYCTPPQKLLVCIV